MAMINSEYAGAVMEKLAERFKRLQDSRSPPAAKTPKTLQHFAADSFASYIVEYCQPAIHDYLMINQISENYKQKLDWTLKPIRPVWEKQFNISTYIELASYLKKLRDFYWESCCLAGIQSSFLRGLISSALIDGMNDEYFEPRIISGMCKFLIQLLFCLEAGGIRDVIRVMNEMECIELGGFLKLLSPFFIHHFDMVNLRCCNLYPIKVIFDGAPNLIKLSINESRIGAQGMQLVQRMFGNTLQDVCIYRGGPMHERYDLFKFFFGNMSRQDVSRAIKDVGFVPKTFPRLRSAALGCQEMIECFQSLLYTLLNCYHNHVTSAYILINNNYLHCNWPICVAKRMCCRYQGCPPIVRIRYSNPFAHGMRYRSTVLQICASHLWYEENVQLMANIMEDMGSSSLQAKIEHEKIFNITREEASRLFNMTFTGIGRLLSQIHLDFHSSHYAMALLDHLHLCQLLRELAIGLSQTWFLPSLEEPWKNKKKPLLHNLTTICFSGSIDKDSASPARYFDLVMSMAPNLSHLSLSNKMVWTLAGMDLCTFRRIQKLQLKNFIIPPTLRQVVINILESSPSIRQIILNNVGKDFKLWTNRYHRKSELQVTIT